MQVHGVVTPCKQYRILYYGIGDALQCFIPIKGGRGRGLLLSIVDDAGIARKLLLGFLIQISSHLVDLVFVPAVTTFQADASALSNYFQLTMTFSALHHANSLQIIFFMLEQQIGYSFEFCCCGIDNDIYGRCNTIFCFHFLSPNTAKIPCLKEQSTY